MVVNVQRNVVILIMDIILSGNKFKFKYLLLVFKMNRLLKLPKNINRKFSYSVSPPIIYTNHVPNYWGIASSFDCKNCNDNIKNKDKIQEYVYDLCKLIDMKRFGDCQVVHFGEDEKVAGYSMVQLIETSLISGHFANSTNAAYIDVFSCKPYDTLKVLDFTQKFFGSKNASMNVVYRV